MINKKAIISTLVLFLIVGCLNFETSNDPPIQDVIKEDYLGLVVEEYSGRVYYITVEINQTEIECITVGILEKPGLSCNWEKYNREAVLIGSQEIL